jgi:hypothetical protein
MTRPAVRGPMSDGVRQMPSRDDRVHHRHGQLFDRRGRPDEHARDHQADQHEPQIFDRCLALIHACQATE